jgi:hypothetical protein
VTVLAVAGLAALAPTEAAGGQRARPRAPSRTEARLDFLGPDPSALHVGVGVNVPAGTYLRLGLVAAGGASRDAGRTAGSARADVVGRFLFDPFRERRWGFSGGGGVSTRYDRAADGRRRWRALVTLLADLEGPRVRSVAPALQLGLGGGFRAGVILRSSGANLR